MKFEKSGILTLGKGKTGRKKNVLEHDGVFYRISNISTSFEHSKGGNSSVFILRDVNTKTETIVKFSKYHLLIPASAKERSEMTELQKENYKFKRKRNVRFEQEIEALKIAKESSFLNIVELKFDGQLVLPPDNRVFPYFVMEKANSDLKEFILQNPELTIQDRLGICIDIMKAVKELHGKTIYHRDIKPDNILLFDNQNKDVKRWKLSDLGLIYNEMREDPIDSDGERIGPYGWLSPEAMNKVLTEKTKLNFDCKIDDYSDIFQLGKVFWFIFQGNVPIGQIEIDDFRLNSSEKEFLFSTLRSMLEYSKNRRVVMKDLEDNLHLLSQELYAVHTL